MRQIDEAELRSDAAVIAWNEEQDALWKHLDEDHGVFRHGEERFSPEHYHQRAHYIRLYRAAENGG